MNADLESRRQAIIQALTAAREFPAVSMTIPVYERSVTMRDSARDPLPQLVSVAPALADLQPERFMSERSSMALFGY